MIPGVDARNGILSALGHPWRTVRSDDDTVGCRAFAEIDQFERAIPRIEPPQCAVALAGEPDRAIRRGRDVMRAGAGGDRIIFYAERTLLGASTAQQGGSGQDSGGGGVEKLAAIHCVIPGSRRRKLWTRRST